MAMIYVSPDPYHEAFEQTVTSNGLPSISPSTPTACIHDWRAWICGAWLIRVDATTIGSIADVATAFAVLRLGYTLSTTLLFSHPKI